MAGAEASAAVHKGLFIADGSLMSTALGVNPFMTIGALSERVAKHIIANPAWAELFDTSSSSEVASAQG